MKLHLDHLAVVGEVLAQAETHVEQAIAHAATGHGAHDHFATHNALWGMGSGFYLEAIAIDPDAENPLYPRWFGLDDFRGPARLGTWILATDDMGAALDILGPNYGTPVALQRGNYRWLISVPASGANGFDGMAPSIIQWQGDLHPADQLPDCGEQFQALNVQHPLIDDLKSQIAPYLTDDRITFSKGSAGLSAQFHGPNGSCKLS